MIADARQNYGGRWYFPGERMDVLTERDASDLEALHFAHRAPIETKVPGYERQDMQARTAPAQNRSQRRAQTYRDRNLKATP